ncbi:unnamed protein product [Sphagnum jensenii]|uniref:Uncharacterized protein n=1 Tax=Sphagnum jensenii TaxID=128206 RepID=A0ABP0XAR2_9BRYO
MEALEKQSEKVMASVDLGGGDGGGNGSVDLDHSAGTPPHVQLRIKLPVSPQTPPANGVVLETGVSNGEPIELKTECSGSDMSEHMSRGMDLHSPVYAFKHTSVKELRKKYEVKFGVATASNNSEYLKRKLAGQCGPPRLRRSSGENDTQGSLQTRLRNLEDTLGLDAQDTERDSAMHEELDASTPMKKQRSGRKAGGANQWSTAAEEIRRIVRKKRRNRAFPPQTLVWAKLDNCPWWPARVVNLEELPDDLYEKRLIGWTCVKFYGSPAVDKRPFAWLKRENLASYKKFRQDFNEQVFPERLQDGSFERALKEIVEEARRRRCAEGASPIIVNNNRREDQDTSVEQQSSTAMSSDGEGVEADSRMVKEADEVGNKRTKHSAETSLGKHEQIKFKTAHGSEEGFRGAEKHLLQRERDGIHRSFRVRLRNRGGEVSRKRKRATTGEAGNEGVNLIATGTQVASGKPHLQSTSRKVVSEMKFSRQGSGKKLSRDYSRSVDGVKIPRQESRKQKKTGDDGYYYDCEVCGIGGELLCCDHCPRVYHLDCLTPPLKRTPTGKWVCPKCRNQPLAHKSSVSLNPNSQQQKEKSAKRLREEVDTKLQLKKRVRSKVDDSVKGGHQLPKCADCGAAISSSRSGLCHVCQDDRGEARDCPSARPSQEEKQVERILGCRVMGKHSLKASPTKRKVKSERVERTEEVKLAVGDLGNGILVDDDTGTMERSAEDTAAGFMIVKRPRATSAAEPWPYTLENQLGGEPMDIDSEMTAGIGAEMLQDQQPSANLQSGGDQGQNTHKAQTENEDCRDRISIGTATKMNSCPVKPLLASGPGGLREACEGSTSLVIEIGDVNTNTDVLQMSSDMTEKSNGDISKAKEGTKEVWQAMMCSSSDNQGKDRVVEANLESEGVRTDTKEVSGGTFPTGKSTEQELEFEFLVKWVGRSHIHNSWVSDSRLRLVAKRKLENYKSKYGTMPLVIMQDQWLLPMRILAQQTLKSGSTEVLVKWQGLPYDECTWEPVSDPIIANNQELLAVFDRYEKEAYAKADRMSAGSCRPSEIEPLVEQPEWLKGGSLFPHQMEALNWLRKSWHRQKNVILADEMGLGKTISACAFLSSLHHEFGTRAPCLVLVPLSTMPNWLAEFSLWAPSLNVIEYHGSAKARAVIREYEWYASPPAGQDAKRSDTQAFKFNVMLTSYEMVIADSSQLRAVQWETLIVDEGHRLKNSESKLFNLLNTYSFGHRVLLTGTPLQNNLGEMYNLLNFLQPDTFPSLAAFQDTFKLLSTADQVEELKKLVAPHMLRRLKKDAMQNIPPKVERVVPVELTSVQAEYYRALLTKNYQLLRQVSGGKAGGQQQSMLNIMMQLRKVCNHPYLLAGSEPEGGSSKFLQDMRIKASAKLTLLHSMLQILKKAGHRVLIFSQMTKLLDILEDYLTFQFGQESFERVDGSVPVAERQAAIMRFNQDPSRFVFLLSTRSCGLGINLATADTVIIYDSDFNPHADIQAMNRAHRIGQSKTLLVYRMVVRASVEERILQLAKKKLMLDHLFASKSGSQKEIEDIIRWGTEELFHKDGGSSPQPEEPQSYPGKLDTDNGVNAESKPEKKGGFSSPTDTTRSAHGTESKDQLKKPVVLEDGDEDNSHKKERPKIVWDDAAVSRLLDRSELGTSNLDVVEGEPENDWLGSLKTWDWSEQDGLEEVEAEEVTAKDSDMAASKTDTTEEEENKWEKLLRTRWEKLQTENEAALGRGKRLRKIVSYNESILLKSIETSVEACEEEAEGESTPDPAPEYTPAGRALKQKMARLRARQKDRLLRSRETQAQLAQDEKGTEGSYEPEKSPALDLDTRPAAGQISLADASGGPMLPSKEFSTGGRKQDFRQEFRRPPSVSATLQASLRQLLPQSSRFPFGSSQQTLRPPPLLFESSGRSFGQSGVAAQSQAALIHLASHEVSPSGLPRPVAEEKLHGPGEVLGGLPEFHGLGSLEYQQRSFGRHPHSTGLSSATTSANALESSLQWEGREHQVGTRTQELLQQTENQKGGSPLPQSTPDQRNSVQLLPGNMEQQNKEQSPRTPDLSMTLGFGGLALSSHEQALLARARANHDSQFAVGPQTKSSAALPMAPGHRLNPGDATRPQIQEMGLPFNNGNHLGQAIPLQVGSIQKSYPLVGSQRGGQDRRSRRSQPEEHDIVVNQVQTWTEDELDALWTGVRRHGLGNWFAMLQDQRLCFSRSRTANDLADRWREEQLKTFGVPPPDMPRNTGAQHNNPLSSRKDRSSRGSRGLCSISEVAMQEGHNTHQSEKGSDALLPSSIAWSYPTPNVGAAELVQDKKQGCQSNDPAASSPFGEMDIKPIVFKDFPLVGASALVNQAVGLSLTDRDSRLGLEAMRSIDLASSRSTGDFPAKEAWTGSANFLESSSGAELPGMIDSRPSAAGGREGPTPVITAENSLDSMGKAKSDVKRESISLQQQTGKPELPPLSHAIALNEAAYSGATHSQKSQDHHSLPFPQVPSATLGGAAGESSEAVSPSKSFLQPVHIGGLVPGTLESRLASSASIAEMDRRRLRTGLISKSTSALSTNDGSQSLPHWLREAFKPEQPPPPKPVALSPTIAAVAEATEFLYKDCETWLPPFVHPGPPPTPPRNFSKRNKKQERISEGRIPEEFDSVAGSETVARILPHPVPAQIEAQSQFPALPASLQQYAASLKSGLTGGVQAGSMPPSSSSFSRRLFDFSMPPVEPSLQSPPFSRPSALAELMALKNLASVSLPPAPPLNGPLQSIFSRSNVILQGGSSTSDSNMPFGYGGRQGKRLAHSQASPSFAVTKNAQHSIGDGESHAAHSRSGMDIDVLARKRGGGEASPLSLAHRSGVQIRSESSEQVHLRGAGQPPLPNWLLPPVPGPKTWEVPLNRIDLDRNGNDSSSETQSDPLIRGKAGAGHEFDDVSSDETISDDRT